MSTFGNRPDDVLQDSRGNVLSGVALTLFGSKADALAQTAPLSSATSNGSGRWPVVVNGYDQVWVRDPSGNVWPVESEESGATIAGKVDKGQLVINVADYATPQLAAAALTTGARLLAKGTINLTSRITIPVSGVDVDFSKATVNMATWAEPCFDLLGVNDVSIDVGNAVFTGTRGGLGSSYRGSSGYVSGNVVWSNGDRNAIRVRRSQGIAVPVFLSAWNGTGTYDRQSDGCSVTLGDVSGANFGLLYSWVKNLTIIAETVHDDIDDSSGANPTHAVYGSSDATHRSTNVKMVRGHAYNIANGHGFQFKYTDQLSIGPITAADTKGFLNILDCDDLNWSGGSATGQLNTGGSGGISVGFSTAAPKRLNLANVSLTLATGNDERAVSIWADDAKISNLSVEANNSAGVNTGLNAVVLRGARGKAAGVAIRSLGAGHMRGIATGIGTDTVADWEITDPRVTGSRSVVDVLASSTNVRVKWDKAIQTLTGAGAQVGVTGTATGNELSMITPRHAYLSTFGTGPGMAALLSGGTVIVPVANNAIQVLVTPDCDIAVSSLLWFSTTASGNYDIAIVDDALATRLWSKGSTAWPAAGTITETVTGVTMRAGRTYRISFAADNTTGALRGATAAAGDVLTRMDGLFAAYLTTALFPIGATPVRGTGASTRVPFILVVGS